MTRREAAVRRPAQRASARPGPRPHLGLGRDLSEDHHHVGLGGRLARHLGVGVLRQARVQDRIGHLVAELVGVPLLRAGRGEGRLFTQRRNFRSPSDARDESPTRPADPRARPGGRTRAMAGRGVAPQRHSAAQDRRRSDPKHARERDSARAGAGTARAARSRRGPQKSIWRADPRSGGASPGRSREAQAKTETRAAVRWPGGAAMPPSPEASSGPRVWRGSRGAGASVGINISEKRHRTARRGDLVGALGGTQRGRTAAGWAGLGPAAARIGPPRGPGSQASATETLASVRWDCARGAGSSVIAGPGLTFTDCVRGARGAVGHPVLVRGLHGSCSR